MPLLLAVGLLAASLAAILDGIRGGTRGRGLGYLLAVLAVPFEVAGLLALYVVIAAY